MKKLFTILLVLVVSFGTSSCMNLIEKIFFNADGSGSYSFTMDMSELKSLAEMSGEELSSADLKEEINFDDNETVRKLTSIDGISEVSTKFDDDNFSMTVRFDFNNINALNAGMSTYFADSTKSEIEMFEFFDINKKKISRIDTNPMLDAFLSGLNEQGEDEQANIDMMKMMLSDLSFTSEIATAKKIKSFSNKAYKSKDDKSISWTFYPFQEVNTSRDISVTLKTK